MSNKKTAIRLNISRSPQMKSIIQMSDSGSEPGSAVKPKFHTIEKLTAAAFGQRRKMIRSSLKAYSQFFKELNLNETLRAENLTPQDFVMLAKVIEKKS